MEVPELNVVTYERAGERFWRMGYQFTYDYSGKPKTCTKCKKLKQLDEYSLDPFRRDGHKSVCKECTNRVIRQWRAKNRERHNANKKKWWKKNKDEQNKARRENYSAK